jgi:hypothetical protein
VTPTVFIPNAWSLFCFRVLALLLMNPEHWDCVRESWSDGSWTACMDNRPDCISVQKQLLLQTISHFAFKPLTAVTVESTILWDMTSCHLLLAWFFSLMCSSEILMNLYQTVWCLALRRQNAVVVMTKCNNGI